MKNENLIELKKIADLICEVRNKTDELLSDLRDDDSCFSDSDIEHDVLFVLENAESAIDSIIDDIANNAGIDLNDIRYSLHDDEPKNNVMSHAEWNSNVLKAFKPQTKEEFAKLVCDNLNNGSF